MHAESGTVTTRARYYQGWEAGTFRPRECPRAFAGTENSKFSTNGSMAEWRRRSPTVRDVVGSNPNRRFSGLHVHTALILVLYAYSDSVDDFVAVDMVDGHVRVSVRVDGTRVHALTTRRVNDGNWHQLNIRHRQASIVVSVDDCDDDMCAPCTEPAFRLTLSTSGADSIRRLALLASDTTVCLRTTLHVEPLRRRANTLSAYAFTGCIRGVQWQRQPMAMTSNNADTGASEPLSACTRRTPSCSLRPCGVHEPCIDRWDHHVCLP